MPTGSFPGDGNHISLFLLLSRKDRIWTPGDVQLPSEAIAQLVTGHRSRLYFTPFALSAFASPCNQCMLSAILSLLIHQISLLLS